MNSYTQLRSLSFFNGLDDESVRILADRATIKAYAAGERIITREDRKRAFYITLSGRVKIFRTNAEGKEHTLYLVEDGQPFCFCTVFEDKPYPVSVEALVDSRMASIPAEDMEDLARKQPLFMLKMLQTLSARLLDAMNMVESLALQGIQQRVASFLLHAESREAAEAGQEFSLPVSHREMAKIVGTTPETVSRVVQKFKSSGLIASSGRRIRILNREALFEV